MIFSSNQTDCLISTFACIDRSAYRLDLRIYLLMNKQKCTNVLAYLALDVVGLCRSRFNFVLHSRLGVESFFFFFNPGSCTITVYRSPYCFLRNRDNPNTSLAEVVLTPVCTVKYRTIIRQLYYNM